MTEIENREELVQKFQILAQNFATEMAKKSLDEVESQAKVLLVLAESAETKTEIKFFNELLDRTVNFYTSEARIACYKDAFASGDPMKFACLHLTFNSIRVQETRDKDTRETIRKVTPCKKDIELLDLNKWVIEHKNARGIGVDTTWPASANGLNAAMARATALEIGDKVAAAKLLDPTGFKKVNNIDLEYALSSGDFDNFVSIIHKMIGDGFKHDYTEDWRVLYRTFTTRNKKKENCVKTMSPAAFAAALKDICHCVLVDGHYTLETDLLKKEK